MFPNLPTGLAPRDAITRDKIYRRLDLFTDLRNRAVHHEPIIYGIDRPDETPPVPPVALVDAHAAMVEMLGWIDPGLAVGLAFIDRFPVVHLHERSGIETELRARFTVP